MRPENEAMRNEALSLRAEGKTYSEIGAALGFSREIARKLAPVVRLNQPPVKRDGPRVEHWRPVVGWEGFYEVSDLGRMWSCLRRGPSGKISGGHLMKLGYCRRTKRFAATLFREGRLVTRPMHTLVLEAFAGPRPAGYEGCHGPGGSCDNRWPENLYWATRSQNQGADKRRDGTYGRNRGQRNGNARLTEEIVRKVRSRYAAGGVLQYELAAEFGLSRQTVNNLILRKSWNWLADEDAA